MVSFGEIDHIEFCSVCGKQLIKDNVLCRFSRKTGNPIFMFRCPSNNCEHDEHHHNYINRGFGIARFFSGDSSESWFKRMMYDLICTKCGKLSFTCSIL